MVRRWRWIGALSMASFALAASAQSVSLSGSLGDKALLIIDGTPRTVATGATVQGVRLVSVAGSDAVIEVKGQRVKLVLGGAQVSIGGTPSAGSGSQIVLSAGSGGHFSTLGSINGKSVRFMVDTGATNVAMSQSDADRIGIDYRNARRIISNTANGAVQAYSVSLGVVRVGDVQVYDVEATVVPMPMQQVLLGNSFLMRFQMKRVNDILTLDLKP